MNIYKPEIIDTINKQHEKNFNVDAIFFNKPFFMSKFYKKGEFLISERGGFATTEFYYLTKNIINKILFNKDWFFSGQPIDIWYWGHIKCATTANVEKVVQCGLKSSIYF